MSAITTAQAGNWGVGSTWTGGVVPVDGDTVTLNHAVTLSDARTVGASPGADDATPAILCNANLTIAATGVLTCRGDIDLDTGGLILQAGATLEFDASQAGDPGTAAYVCRSLNAVAGDGKLTISGSSGSRCTVRSNAGGANGSFIYQETGDLVVDYCDFARIGLAMSPWTAAIAAAAGSGESFHLGNCTFDADCGPIGERFGLASNPAGDVELINVTHRGPFAVGLPAEAPTTGARTISGCRLDFTYLWQCTGYSISDTAFKTGWDFTEGPLALWENNLLAQPEASLGDLPAPGAIHDTYVVFIGDPGNLHGLTVGDHTEEFDGCIFDLPDGDSGQGDCITFNQLASATTIPVRRCIVLPNAAGLGTGSLLSCLGGSNANLIAEHNTYCGTFGVYVGESYSGHANMVVSLKSNMAWSGSANSALIIRADPGTAEDVVAAADATNNGTFNPNGDGYGSDLTFSTGSPGANDVDGDPEFVDSARNIKTWDTSLGGAGTVANALVELYKKNDAAGYNAAYSIAALLAYVRAGFNFRNADFHDAGHDGTDIGAGEFEPPANPGVLQSQNLASTMYAALP